MLAYLTTLAKTAVTLGLLALAAASLAPLFGRLAPALSIAEHFALQILAAAVLLTVLALLFKLHAWAVIGSAIAVFNLVIVWPFLPLPGIAQAAYTGPALKVISLNVWYLNDGYDPALRYLRQSNADVIGLVEVSPDWKRALQPLDAVYPYRSDCIGTVPNCEVLLLSKYPLEPNYTGRIDGHLPAIVWGSIAWGGRSITIAETHVTRPIKSGDPRAQGWQMDRLAGYLNSLGPDLVVMGDFNSVPWSTTQSALRKTAGLHNEGRLALTWPAWGWPFIRLPIDQIFTRGDLAVTGFKAGPDVGSDHLPVEAVVYRR